MPLWSSGLSSPLSRSTGAIAVSGILIVFAFIYMVLCLSQLSASPPLMSSTQATFAIASILQVLLVALGFTIIFASWKKNSRVIRFSAYATVAHLALNVTVLALLLAAVVPTMPCPTRDMRCPKTVIPVPAWIALSAVILVIQPCLSLIVFSYSFHLQDRSRPPEARSRGLSLSVSHKPTYKRLSSTSGSWSNMELGVVEPSTTIRSLKTPEPGAGYGGGMRTYEEAEQNEKERLRRQMEMENEESEPVSFPVPSTSETGILTPLGLEWRDGDLPPYAS